jgi:hypothetical protein
VSTFHQIRPHGIGSERDGPVSLTDGVVVGFGVGKEKTLVEIAQCLARQRIGVVRVHLERLLEQSPRRIDRVLIVSYPVLFNEGQTAHGEVDGVGAFGAGAPLCFRLDQFNTQRVGQSPHHLILQLEQVGHVLLEAFGPEMRA